MRQRARRTVGMQPNRVGSGRITRMDCKRLSRCLGCLVAGAFAAGTVGGYVECESGGRILRSWFTGHEQFCRITLARGAIFLNAPPFGTPVWSMPAPIIAADGRVFAYGITPPVGNRIPHWGPWVWWPQLPT